MTLGADAIAAAARHVHALQSSGRSGERLPVALRPLTPADGWRIQRAVSTLRAVPVIGWKCGLPAADRWVVAALHEVCASGADVQAQPGPAGWPRVEPELAFELAHDLPPRALPYTAAEVHTAIGAVRLAVEVLGCRFVEAASASGPELMADGLWHAGLVAGPVWGDVLPQQPAFQLRLQVEGRPSTTVAAQHPDGDPRRPLCWLAEFLRQQGIGLKAGQFVITGSLAGAIDMPYGAALKLGFGDHGDVELMLHEHRPLQKLERHTPCD